MNMRFGKLMLAAALAGTVVAGSVPAVALAQGEGAALQAQAEGRGTWEQSGSRWWFATEGGGYLQGGLWYVNNVPYIFDANGWLITGRWTKLSDGMWYLSETNGVVAQGWRNLYGVWYYLNPDDDGSMVTGWKAIGGAWYRFDSNGAMCTGWQQIAGDWFYFGASGAMYENRWLKSGSYWYYLGSGGAMVTGWQQINGEDYCFSESDSNKTPMGGMFTGLVRVGDTSQFYFFYDDGTMARDVWIDTGSFGTMYFGSDGIGTPAQ